MTRKAPIAKILVLAVAAGAAFSTHAQSQRECDVCPLPSEAQPAVVVDAGNYRECDTCVTAEEQRGTRIRLTELSASESDAR